MTPGLALYDLLSALDERGIGAKGMTVSRLGGTLFPARLPPVGYRCGFFWWRTGRSRKGRPLYAIHPANDPIGAAGRLIAADEADRDTLRQALEDAIRMRFIAAAGPCPACVTHPALLCVDHAAELDWASLYRRLAHDLGIGLDQAEATCGRPG